MYLGDFALESNVDTKFCTVAAATGAPTQLAGSPVISAYPDNSTTQLTAGITLTVDFDSVTGLNHVRVAATAGNGYAAGSTYVLVITTGTVGGVSVVGYVVGAFSLRARSALMPTTAGRTLVVDASGNADARLADAVSHGGTLGSSTATFALSRMSVTSQTVNQAALTLQGNGTREGLRALGGATGEAIGLVGGGTSGDGIRVTTTDGHGINLAPAGNSKHGILATGGNSGTSDGIKAVAGTGGVDIRGAITGNITGNLSGSVGSVTAAVSANVTQFGGTNGTFASGRPEVNATHIAGSAVSTTNAQIGVNVVSVVTDAITSTAVSSAAVTKIQTGLATPTNITAGTITTVTNLTNAPTAGDLTATMKASVNAEVDTALADVGLTTTVTGRIDAAISSRLASASYTAPLDAAGTRAAIGLASANLDTQIAALPTDSDVQTAAAAAITAAEPIDADIKRINGTVVNGDGGSTPWGP